MIAAYITAFTAHDTITLIILIFFFNDTATTEIYTLSIHDALPISSDEGAVCRARCCPSPSRCERRTRASGRDRKSTRLNSSHRTTSYALFCLKKKNRHFPFEHVADVLDLAHVGAAQRLDMLRPFFIKLYGPPADLHSFPTRRSSD